MTVDQLIFMTSQLEIDFKCNGGKEFACANLTGYNMTEFSRDKLSISLDFEDPSLVSKDMDAFEDRLEVKING